MRARGAQLPLRRSHHAGNYAGMAQSQRLCARRGLRRTVWCKVVGVALAAAYLLAMVPADRSAVGWWCDRSLAVKRMVLGVARAHELHPNQRFCWMAWTVRYSGGAFSTGLFPCSESQTFTSHRGQKVTLTGILNKARL